MTQLKSQKIDLSRKKDCKNNTKKHLDRLQNCSIKILWTHEKEQQLYKKQSSMVVEVWSSELVYSLRHWMIISDD